jgi:hypothetical protein
MDAPFILALAGYEQQIASQMRVSWDCSVFYSHAAAPCVRLPVRVTPEPSPRRKCTPVR